ncbi:Uncharacterized protein dnl_05450 [Desulfonema limicola]|uniref:Uncharacterized protein n=1 Tax=Desulfonema limicola TaxID=45656 RepID=A0A975B3Z6_9BACT|nr:Uncharacterized protein dnl_05450 [Desulfonema limicola]
MDYLYHNFLPDALFILERIRSPKEYLEKIKKIVIPADYAETEKQYWQRLTDEIQENRFNDFFRLCSLLFEYKQSQKQ